MIDFVKFQIKNADTKALLENNLLDFVGTHSISTGVVGSKRTAKYKGLKFIIDDGGCTLVQGSLHKYWNDGFHNHNSFTFENLQSVLKDLVARFNINLAECVLQNIEAGVNITLPIPVKTVLNNLLFHKCEKFKDASIKGGNFKEAEHSQYYLKIYDKGLQYKIPENLMRFELKFSKMKKVNEVGVMTLLDLQNKAIFKPLEGLLLDGWEKVTLFDGTLKTDQLSSYQRKVKVHQWRNADYWLSLKKNQRCRELKTYLQLVRDHSDNMQEMIKGQIADKWRYLTAN